MGTCCSTDSRPANADAVIGDDLGSDPQTVQGSKSRQVHSRAPGQEDVHQNPEIEAQEIEVRLQQSEQEGHSEEKSKKVHGESRGEERRHGERDRENDGHRGEERGREERYRENESRGEERYRNDRENERYEGESRGEERGHEERPAAPRNQESQAEENQTVEGELREMQVPVEEVLRESELGVTYYVNAHTQAVIRIQVNASEAKGNIQEVEAKIRSENEHLRSISISFSHEETENMDYFITELLKTSTYTSINVLFASLTLFSEQALHTFSEIIANSPLEKLYIMHISHDATDHFFTTVMPAVQTRKDTLKELSIQSGNCQELSDETIKHVKNAIEWNQVLEYVALYFGNTTKITDNAIIELRSGFNLKSQLKKLELGFMNMPQLTDEALIPFCEIAEGLHNHNLESLDIITPEAGFTEEKYKKFQSVINSYNLKNVNLYWRDEPVTEQAEMQA